MNEHLSQLCTPERAEDAAGMDLTRLCTVQIRSETHVSQPSGHLCEAQPVQASDAGEESRVGILDHCESCCGEGDVIHVFAGGSVAYATECIPCKRRKFA